MGKQPARIYSRRDVGNGGQGEGESCKSLDFGSIATDYLKEKTE